MNYLTRMMSSRNNAAKRQRHRERVAAANAKQEAELEAQAERLGVSVFELKRAMAMSAEQASEAPARARAKRHAEIEARDAEQHRKVDAALAAIMPAPTVRAADLLFLDDVDADTASWLDEQGHFAELARFAQKHLEAHTATRRRECMS